MGETGNLQEEPETRYAVEADQQMDQVGLQFMQAILGPENAAAVGAPYYGCAFRPNSAHGARLGKDDVNDSLVFGLSRSGYDHWSVQDRSELVGRHFEDVFLDIKYLNSTA